MHRFSSLRRLALLCRARSTSCTIPANAKLLLVRSFSEVKERQLDDNLKKYMHGRGNRERRDSVTNTILLERHEHLERIRRLPVEDSILNALRAEGLGDRKRKHQVYAPTKSLMFGGGSYGNEGFRKTNAGAGGFAVHLSSATKDWPIFKHLLPEIAFAGHSNAGKSTLVNAMIGVLPSKGPAKVSERAGWTDQICFYQLGKKPPVLTLADLPGYGHAVASGAQRKAWANMMRDYLQNRAILSRCCILVDCTRGLCRQDKLLVKFLTKRNVPWMVVLTKGDLLDATALAQCVLAVQLDLAPFLTPADPDSVEGSDEPPRVEDRPRNRGERKSGSDGTRNSGLNQPLLQLKELEGELEVAEEDWGEGSDPEDVHTDSDVGSGAETDSDSSDSDEEKSSDGKAGDDDNERSVVERALENVDIPNKHLVPVQVISSSTGAGVRQLWRRLCDFAKKDAPLPRGVIEGGASSGAVVREHYLASAVRAKRLVRIHRDRMTGRAIDTGLGYSDSPRASAAAPGTPGDSRAKHRGRPPPVRVATNRRGVRARMRAEKEKEAETKESWRELLDR